jgi:hypothetical protein
MAMPRGISIKKVIALVNAMAKLHNFCIDQVDRSGEGGNELEMDQPTAQDRFNMMDGTTGYVDLEDDLVPRQLLESGHHFDDVPRNRRVYRRPVGVEGVLSVNLPRKNLHDKVLESHKVRPSLKAGK